MYKKGEEGFHLIEHILLRPLIIRDDAYLLSPCIQDACEMHPGLKDPYSFRMSLVIPYWTGRCKDLNFRTFFEKIAREEAPAHIHVKVCWADEIRVSFFEYYYRLFLTEFAREYPDHHLLAYYQDRLTLVLGSIFSVYERVSLYDATHVVGENLVVLNKSKLGIIKEEQDGEV
jgi:hypothetical protein